MTLRRALTTALLGWTAVSAAVLLVFPDHADAWPVGTYASWWLYAASVVLCAWRARTDGLPWVLLAGGLACWALADGYWDVVLADLDDMPVPSIADAGYLAGYPLLFAGLVVLVRRRIPSVSATLWVDGLTAATAAGALAAAIVFPAVLGGLGGDPVDLAVSLAYPVADVAILGVLAGALVVTGWRLDRTLWLVLGGLVAMTIADCLYLVQVAADSYSSPSPVDLGWKLMYALLGVAALTPSRDVMQARRHGLVVVPPLLAVTALGLLVAGTARVVDPVAVGLSALSLGAVVARLLLTVREHAAVLRAWRREAVTDALTGLGNRRALARDLDERLQDDAPWALVLFDLDGFKHYNDAFGHPAGDALLQRLGRKLREHVEADGGRAYRMGGDEFCALLPITAAAAPAAAARSAQALVDQGETWKIGASHGVIALPDEAADAETAMRLADQRLYADKASGRASPGRQATEALLRVAEARRPGRRAHAKGVAALAVAIGEELRLTGDVLEHLGLAAELHDVGLLAIPDAIVHAPRGLTRDERRFVRQHPLIAERVLRAVPTLVPVAELVRSASEHLDGAGYPDGLAGEAIPLASRIVAVANAYDAMRRDRPHRAARTDAGARDELRRCAGTQFDPDVVDACLRVLAHARAVAA